MCGSVQCTYCIWKLVSGIVSNLLFSFSVGWLWIVACIAFVPYFYSGGIKAESIKGFIEDQAFSPSYDLAPASPSHVSTVSLSQSSCVSPVELSDGRGGGGSGRSQSYDRQKAWSSINHSILSVLKSRRWLTILSESKNYNYFTNESCITTVLIPFSHEQ